MSSVARPGSGLVHDVLFYAEEDALLATLVPFVREGIERGEVVLVGTGPHPATVLLRALFSDEPTVLFSEGTHVKPVAAIDHYKRTMDRGLAGNLPGYRAVGHIDFAVGALPWREWVRYEAAVNQVFASYPLRTLCSYDTRTVAPEVVTAMRRTHPWVREEGLRFASPDYIEPSDLLSRPEYAEPPDPLQGEPPDLEIVETTDLRRLRVDLYPVTLLGGLARRKVDDFVKAVGEIAANAWRHGQEPVRIRVWSMPDRLVCTVTDQGPGIDDPLRGYARSIGNATTQSLSTHEGLGLWAARQLCDLLDYERTNDGFSVRLTTFAG